ncbi:hypothetical protein MPNT_170064 [Candidatus Methylacidithermus pantelleriae]|uniref:Uncharacterized protein n=1 Tax=Candidatus Methylacidithermus pantelleriae TaxID=2744239 RepID=A0A8J2BHH4_9BACT|nr:hypothetical protein MPNT_170064 [Candidatus Methylacidithermus pantelleriae]
MVRTTIDRLIINSPYEEPKRHWRYDRETRTFELVEGCRPAGYAVATPTSKSFDDPGIFVEVPLVNQIHPRVKAWCEAGLPKRYQYHQTPVGILAQPREAQHTALKIVDARGIESLKVIGLDD